MKHNTFQQRDGWPNVICVACFDVIIDSFESFDDRLVINFRAGLASFASALLGSCTQIFNVWHTNARVFVDDFSRWLDSFPRAKLVVVMAWGT